MLQTIKDKLTSRKFWTMLLGAGISIAGVITSDNTTVQFVCTITSAVFGIAYMLIEGKCDWESIKAKASVIIDAVQDYTEDTTNAD